MPKNKKCPEPVGEVPAWFMTYSDVITLLMTFFILLLTFSTNEPEFFSKVQVVAFGGGGSTGMAQTSDTFVDADVPILRFRPSAARLTTRGSETPPTETDYATETLSKGLKSLDKTNEMADSERIRLETPVSVMRDSEGNPTDYAQWQLTNLAIQLRNMPMELGFRVGTQKDADFCVKLAMAMSEELDVPVGRISVSTVAPQTLTHGHMEMILTRTDTEKR